MENDSSSLYALNENVCMLWIDVFPFTHEDQREGPVDYFGVIMGADGMEEPKAYVQEEGIVLKIISFIPSTRQDIDDAYEDRQKKYMAKAVDQNLPNTT